MDSNGIMNMLRKMASDRTNIMIIALAALIIVFSGYAATGYLVADNPGGSTGPVEPSEITTFTDNGGEVCMEDGKPVVLLFSSTFCPHCKWISDTYDSTVQEYVDKGLIVAKHWELDTKDDTMTTGLEGNVPEWDMSVYSEFNPRGFIPTFVFGCKYSRIGNGHESTSDLEAEEAEFRAVIKALLK